MHKLIYGLMALAFGFFATSTAGAAETAVEPGVGTLAAAVSAAAGGDVLVLENGTYSGNVNINKSLTIRAVNSAAAAMVTDTITINGAGIAVVLQGLSLAKSPALNAAGDVKLLENTFYSSADIDGDNYIPGQGDGSLAIIGNHLTTGAEIVNIKSLDAYIAGNTLDDGRIYVSAPAWIVGNDVTHGSTPVFVSTSGAVQVIGNRVNLNGTLGNEYYGIHIHTAAYALISGNVIQVEKTSGNNGARYGIHVTQPSTYARVFNNVVDGARYTHGVVTGSYAINNADEVIGNIVVDMPKAIQRPSGSTVAYNLCFSNNEDCGTADGNLDSDPQFVNRVEYSLGAGSPAIDTGSDNPAFADLDRTRNDMGAFGGPWSIDQYDFQRDPLYLRPFVYPLFDANGSFTGGELQVRALGVARLR